MSSEQPVTDEPPVLPQGDSIIPGRAVLLASDREDLHHLVPHDDGRCADRDLRTAPPDADVPHPRGDRRVADDGAVHHPRRTGGGRRLCRGCLQPRGLAPSWEPGRAAARGWATAAGQQHGHGNLAGHLDRARPGPAGLGAHRLLRRGRLSRQHPADQRDRPAVVVDVPVPGHRRRTRAPSSSR